MNIFAVDDDPQIAARSLCDKHVVKMLLESSQMLCTAHHLLGSERHPGYWLKAAHWNHPCSAWARKTGGNYIWLAEHGMELCAEYSFRYGRIHKCEREGLIRWLLATLPAGIDHGERTPFVQAMLEEYRREDSIEAYRAYYLGAKRRMLVWTRREPPAWVPQEWLERNGEKWQIQAPLV
jgi:hypothetical protein